jgi:hypothetical protein
MRADLRGSLGDHRGFLATWVLQGPINLSTKFKRGENNLYPVNLSAYQSTTILQVKIKVNVKANIVNLPLGMANDYSTSTTML